MKKVTEKHWDCKTVARYQPETGNGQPTDIYQKPLDDIHHLAAFVIF